MSDICMCTGYCSIKENCYRYTAIPNPYGQTYSCLEDVCISNNYSEFIPDNRSVEKEEDSRNINYTLDDFLLEEIHKTMNQTN